MDTSKLDHGALGPQGEGLWAAAFQRLTAAQRETVRDALLANPTSDPPDSGGQGGEEGADNTTTGPPSLSAPEGLLEICKTKQLEYEKSRQRWTFGFFGTTVKVKDILDDLVKLLDKIKAAGDIAVNADPVHAGLAWAPIRVLLMASTSNAQQAGAIFMGLGKVLRIVSRGKSYEMQLRDQRQHRTCGGLEESIIALYTRVLAFMASAYHVRGRSALRRSLHAFWKSEDIIGFEKDCVGLEEAVRVELDAGNAFATKAMADVLADVVTTNSDLSRSVTETRRFLSHLKDEFNDSKRAEILRWACPLPTDDHHTVAKEGRVRETGDWILEKEGFVHWLESEVPLILWIHGIPGAGKTKLISRIVDYCLDTLQPGSDTLEDDVQEPPHPDQQQSARSGRAFFYCLRVDEARRKPENIFRSFVKQIAQQRITALAPLLTMYKRKQASGFLSNCLSIAECQDLLGQMTSSYTRTILLLDALDECPKESRIRVIAAFQELVDRGLPVKILISSRRNEDIRAELEDCINISISATDNGDDIIRFVRQRLLEFQQSKLAVARAKRGMPLLTAELETRIFSTFMRKSDGMFLWAKMHLEHLLSLERRVSIERALECLPMTLQQTYDEIMEHISLDENGLRDIAHRAIRWLLCQNGTARCRTMLSAVCYNPDEEENVTFDVDVETLLSACQNLVIFVNATDGLDDQFRFAHLSIQEYFETSKIWTSADAHLFAAKICVTRLLDFASLEPFQRAPEDPRYNPVTERYLLDYAAVRWIYHVQSQGTSVQDQYLSTLIGKFLGTPGQQTNALAVWHYKMVVRKFVRSELFWGQKPEPAEGCYLLCAKGALLSQIHVLERDPEPVIFPCAVVDLPNVVWDKTTVLHGKASSSQYFNPIAYLLPSNTDRHPLRRFIRRVMESRPSYFTEDIRETCFVEVVTHYILADGSGRSKTGHKIPRHPILSHIMGCSCVTDGIESVLNDLNVGVVVGSDWDSSTVVNLMQAMAPLNVDAASTNYSELVKDHVLDFSFVGHESLSALKSVQPWTPPVENAIRAGNKQWLDYILSHGAVVQASDVLLCYQGPQNLDIFESTARAFYAQGASHQDPVEILIDHPATGRQAVNILIDAADSADVWACQILCRSGADPCIQETRGSLGTPLTAAVQTHHDIPGIGVVYESSEHFERRCRILKTLLLHGADPKVVSRLEGKTALEIAEQKAPQFLPFLRGEG